MINHIEGLRSELRSATKVKLSTERCAIQAHNRERSLNEKLTLIKGEIEFSKEQLDNIKSQISQARHQISMIEICSVSERSKINAHIDNLQLHMKGFQQLFDKERLLFDKRVKEIQGIEAEEEEVQRQKEKEIEQKNAQEAAAVEAECDALERECAVLKKRNNAIMLQLRRKLFETENSRRELAKWNSKN